MEWNKSFLGVEEAAEVGRLQPLRHPAPLPEGWGELGKREELEWGGAYLQPQQQVYEKSRLVKSACLGRE